MKRVQVVLAIGLVASVLISAESAVPDAPAAVSDGQAAGATPDVDQVLAKYIQAVGGQSAIQKLTTLVMKGSVELPATGEIGTMQVFKKAPDKGLAIMSVPSSGPAPRGFNGRAGWYVDPDEGLKDVAGNDLEAMKREFDFYRDIRLKALYPRMNFKGKEKVAGLEAFVIEATAVDGAVEKMYFDTQSGLLVRNDTPYVTDDGKSAVQTVFEDYREVDGVKLPFVWRQTSPDFDYVIKFDEIRHDVSIDDSKFEKPKP